MDHLIGKDPHRIDYRHIIYSLVRKPGAFRRYVFRANNPAVACRT
jgi:hypothetical protein